MKWNKWEVGLALVLGSLGALVFFFGYERVLPSAAVRPKLSNADAVAVGRDWAAKINFDLSGYRSVALFQGDNDAVVYLQKVVGVDSISSLASSLPLWFWNVRFMKPMTKRELRLRLSPDGRLVGLRELVPEEEAGAYLSPEEAQNLALRALRDYLGEDPAQWELVAKSSEDKKARRDHYFTFKKRGASWGDGQLRAKVTVAGDRVVEAWEFVKVPEAFVRAYSGEKSMGTLLYIIALILSVVMVVGGFVGYIVRVRKGTADTRLGVVVGSIIGVATFLVVVLNIPSILMRYDTSLNLASFLLVGISTALISGLAVGGFVGLAAAWAGPKAEEMKNGILWGLRSLVRGKLPKGLAKAVFLAYFLAFLFMGFQVVVYWFGTRFLGVWTPAESEYTQIYSVALPWLFALVASTYAGFMEESTFRLLGLSALRPIFRNSFLALFVAAALWAFLHSTYAVFPVWFRGLELTLGGLLLAWVFWRFGLIVAILAHFLVDTLYFSIPLIKTGNPGMVASGAFAVLLLAIVGLLAFAFGGEEALEGREPSPEVAVRTLARHLTPELAREILVAAGIDPSDKQRALSYLAKSLFGAKVRTKGGRVALLGLSEEEAGVLGEALGVELAKDGKGWTLRA